MKEWKNVKLTSKGQEYVEPCELKTGLRSSSRAVFFRNTHQTTGEKIVSLKIARYRKVNGTFYEKQDKSISLSISPQESVIDLSCFS